MIGNGTALRSTDKELQHENKVLNLVRERLRDARRSRITGKLMIEIELYQGGPNKTYTQVGMIYRILEE